MHYRQILFIGPAIALSACATANDRRDIPGCTQMECVHIAEAQQVWEGFSVTPMAVLEDSRCPIEAECFWAGRLRVKVQLEIGHERINAEIASDDPMPIHGGVLTLAEIAPDPSTQWSPLKPEDYSFGFRFSPDAIQPSPLR